MQLQSNRSKGRHKFYRSFLKWVLISILSLMPMAQIDSLFAYTQNAPLSQTESVINPALLETAQGAVARVSNRIKPTRTTATVAEILDNSLLEANAASEEALADDESAATDVDTTDIGTEEAQPEETDISDSTDTGDVPDTPATDSALVEDGTLEPEDETAEDITASDTIETDDGAIEVASSDDGEAIPINVDEIDFESYSAGGISIYVPAEWSVSTESLDPIFQISIPDEFFFGLVQSFNSDDFPGALAVVIMQNQAEAFVKQIDESAELLDVEIFVTDQSLPVVKITLSTQIEGIDATGALYVVAPGEGAYMLIALTSDENWPIIAPGVDLTAQSIFFSDELISVTAAEGGELTYTDNAGRLTMTVPENWQVSETGDADLPILLIDPSYKFATSLGIPSQFTEEVDINELFGLAKEGEVEELTQLILSELDLTTNEFVIDEQQTETFALESGFAIRLVGIADLNNGVQMPTLIHFGVLNDNLVGAVTFGLSETISAQEEIILGVLNSVAVVE